MLRSGLFDHLGALHQVTGLYTPGVVGLTHAESPLRKTWGGGAGELLGGAAGGAGGAELGAAWEPGTRALDVVHIGVLRPAWSSGRKGSVAGMAQTAVSVGSTHLASRHLGWVRFLRCLVGYLDLPKRESGQLRLPTTPPLTFLFMSFLCCPLPSPSRLRTSPERGIRRYPKANPQC